MILARAVLAGAWLLVAALKLEDVVTSGGGDGLFWASIVVEIGLFLVLLAPATVRLGSIASVLLCLVYFLYLLNWRSTVLDAGTSCSCFGAKIQVSFGSHLSVVAVLGLLSVASIPKGSSRSP